MRYFFLMTLFSVVVMTPTLLFGTMIGLSTEDLTRKSEVVILGNVRQVETDWSEDGKTIQTRATILVSEVIKGKLAQGDIIVEYAGGEIGDIGLRVSDVSPLSENERVILFLKSAKDKKNGITYRIVGKAQGKYTIDHHGIARKGGFQVIHGREVIDNDIPADELIKKIRRAAW